MRPTHKTSPLFRITIAALVTASFVIIGVLHWLNGDLLLLSFDLLFLVMWATHLRYAWASTRDRSERSAE